VWVDSDCRCCYTHIHTYSYIRIIRSILPTIYIYIYIYRCLHRHYRQRITHLSKVKHNISIDKIVIPLHQ
jgi:hypothetical protein